MRIGVPRERLANEARVAATPKTVEQLLKLGFTVAIERRAGKLASLRTSPTKPPVRRWSTKAKCGSRI